MMTRGINRLPVFDNVEDLATKEWARVHTGQFCTIDSAKYKGVDISSVTTWGGAISTGLTEMIDVNLYDYLDSDLSQWGARIKESSGIPETEKRVGYIAFAGEDAFRNAVKFIDAYKAGKIAVLTPADVWGKLEVRN
jgi:hypothetical protein